MTANDLDLPITRAFRDSERPAKTAFTFMNFGLGMLFFALVALGFDMLFTGSRGHDCYADSTCDPSFVCVQVASEHGTCFELQNLKINGFPWKVRR